MATSTIHSNRVTMKLNNGTHAGVIQTVSVSLPSLNNSGFDADKALNITGALEPMLSKSIERVEHTQTAYLS